MLSNRRTIAARFALPLVMALLCVAVAWPALAQQRVPRSSPPALQGNSTVRVMTRNMDAGTDLKYILAGGDFKEAVIATIGEIVANDPPARAARLAEEIAEKQPDLVGLQEATLWELPIPGGGYDQLALLQKALKERGLHYAVAAVQGLTDITIDVPDVIYARFWDRNAILVRTDLPPGHLEVLGTDMHLFDATFPIDLPPPMEPALEVEGWMAVDVRIRGARFKFVNTHLRSPLAAPYFDYTEDLQWQQATELVSDLASSPLPIVLVGDFNSDASNAGTGPDQTRATGVVLSAGYAEAWHTINPTDEGYTWGIYLEDCLPPTTPIVPAVPNERIDLILSKGPIPLSIDLFGTSTGTVGVHASDHLGVVASFALDNHKPDVPMKAVPRK